MILAMILGKWGELDEHKEELTLESTTVNEMKLESTETVPALMVSRKQHYTKLYFYNSENFLFMSHL